MKVAQLWPHGCPWNSLGQNTGVGRLFFLQGIFPTQGSNPGALCCRQILYQLSHKGSPRILECVVYPFSRDLPDPGIKSGSPVLQADSLPTEQSGKPKSPHVFGPKNQNIKQKQYCNKLNKDLKKRKKINYIFQDTIKWPWKLLNLSKLCTNKT